MTACTVFSFTREALVMFVVHLLSSGAMHEIVHHLPLYPSRKHNGDKFFVFERGPGLVWVFNFHPTKSYTSYRIGASESGRYRIALDTDAEKYHGYSRVDPNTSFASSRESWDGRDHSLHVYVPSRVALVLCKCD